MFRFIVISSLLFLMPSFAMETTPDILLFVGNPGSGKSTIINALAKKNVVNSGFSIGSGLTKDFSQTVHIHEGKQYLLIDTPGLHDIDSMERPAREIENALKLGGNYKIFFVITLEAGRCNDSDLMTIQRILGAINLGEIQYNVIVNKVSRNTKANLINHDVQDMLKEISHKAQNIFFIDWDQKLVDENNVFFQLSPEFEKFIYEESKSIFIKASQITHIFTGTIKDLKKPDEPKKVPVATVAYIYSGTTKDSEKSLPVSIELTNGPIEANYGSVHKEKSKNRRQCLVQ